MPVKPPAPFRIRCVCGESIKVIGPPHFTVEIRRRFALDHRPCREALDAEIKSESKINCARVLTICNA